MGKKKNKKVVKPKAKEIKGQLGKKKRDRQRKNDRSIDWLSI